MEFVLNFVKSGEVLLATSYLTVSYKTEKAALGEHPPNETKQRVTTWLFNVLANVPVRSDR
jgi:hypothetical protein